MSKYGLELLLSSVKEELNQPSDVTFVLLHWIFTSTKDFGCVGLGENFGESDSQPSEQLPSQWNRNNKDDNGGAFYITKYRQTSSNQKYVLKMIFSVGTTWQIILCRTGDDKTVHMSIDVGNEVNDIVPPVCIAGVVTYPFKDLDKLLDRIQKELVEKMFPPEEKTSQREDPQPRLQPPRPDAGQQPTRPREPYPDLPPHQPFPDPDDPFGPFGGGAVFDPPGGADLDPTGRRGRGGMLMEPPRGGMRGPARFDPPNPFGRGGGVGGFPGRIGRGGGGNFGDAMGPPGFNNDNMFM